ncbi:MAG: DEAD/DEAH box helicase [Sulfurimonas sp.]|nr:DEAD/DEAH box helicase [Sulfurimonas sp.]
MSEQTDKPKKIYYDQRSVALRTPQVAYFVQEHDKIAMLDLLLHQYENTQIVVVVKNKRKADQLSELLLSKDFQVLAIHGNHRAEQQLEAATRFNLSAVNILITTDAILETLELKDIKLLISYDLPLVPQVYYNRLAYMKELGEAIALVNPQDDKALSDIEFNMKAEIEEKELEGFVSTPIPQGNRLGRKIKDKKNKPRHRKVKSKKKKTEEGI